MIVFSPLKQEAFIKEQKKSVIKLPPEVCCTINLSKPSRAMPHSPGSTFGQWEINSKLFLPFQFSQRSTTDKRAKKIFNSLYLWTGLYFTFCKRDWKCSLRPLSLSLSLNRTLAHFLSQTLSQCFLSVNSRVPLLWWEHANIIMMITLQALSQATGHAHWISFKPPMPKIEISRF